MSYMLRPDDGEPIRGGGLDATLRVAGGPGAFASTCTITVPPGYDVGAHVHGSGEELFYVVSGRLDILAFEPVDRAVPDWHDWVSTTGERFVSGVPGALLQVPAGVPHAFANPGGEPTTFLFQRAPGGHETYLRALAVILERSGGRPDPEEIDALRREYDITQLTPLRNRP